MNIQILRLGHRFERDRRISTHLALTGRAFGADSIVFDTDDRRITKSVNAVNEMWGSAFEVKFTDNYKKFIKNFPGIKVHLTMYGININDKIGEIKNAGKEKEVLVIVGGKKVPADIYHLVDYNIGVGNQPHSEVAALAVFLDRLLEGTGLEKDLGGVQRIIPEEFGKKVVRD